MCPHTHGLVSHVAPPFAFKLDHTPLLSCLTQKERKRKKKTCPDPSPEPDIFSNVPRNVIALLA